MKRRVIVVDVDVVTRKLPVLSQLELKAQESLKGISWENIAIGCLGTSPAIESSEMDVAIEGLLQKEVERHEVDA